MEPALHRSDRAVEERRDGSLVEVVEVAQDEEGREVVVTAGGDAAAFPSARAVVAAAPPVEGDAVSLDTAPLSLRRPPYTLSYATSRKYSPIASRHFTPNSPLTCVTNSATSPSQPCVEFVEKTNSRRRLFAG